jgi:hypothetical protein
VLIRRRYHAPRGTDKLGVAVLRRASSIIAAATLVGCIRAATSVAPPSAPSAFPRPYRQRLHAAILLNATCVSCHAKQAAEWQGSMHQRAYVNGAFQDALALEPTPFCRGCHAPESDPRGPAGPEVGDLGVGCVSCHIAGDETHPVAASRDPSAACAGCHEFRFPGGASDADDGYMQTTVREHRRSASAARTCASCHMPHGSHAFAGVRDAAWLRARLRVVAELAGADGDGARLTLAQTAPGHAFPTGDLFRRLEVGWVERDAGGRAVRREARHLTRHFEIVPGRPGRQLVDDDRVFDEPRTLEMRFGPSSRSVEWWVTLQRVAQVGTGIDPSAAKVESEVPLYSGVLSRP